MKIRNANKLEIEKSKTIKQFEHSKSINRRSSQKSKISNTSNIKTREFPNISKFLFHLASCPAGRFACAGFFNTFLASAGSINTFLAGNSSDASGKPTTIKLASVIANARTHRLHGSAASRAAPPHTHLPSISGTRGIKNDTSSILRSPSLRKPTQLRPAGLDRH